MERHTIACSRANTAVLSKEDVRHKSFTDVLGSKRPNRKTVVGKRASMICKPTKCSKIEINFRAVIVLSLEAMCICSFDTENMKEITAD